MNERRLVRYLRSDTCSLKPGSHYSEISTSASTNARHTHAHAEMAWFVDD